MYFKYFVLVFSRALLEDVVVECTSQLLLSLSFTDRGILVLLILKDMKKLLTYFVILVIMCKTQSSF